MKEFSTTISVVVPVSIANRLSEAATAAGLSRSEFTRRALERELSAVEGVVDVSDEGRAR